jgi:hypothetical protein
MRVPTLTAAARIALAGVVGAAALGPWPAIVAAEGPPNLLTVAARVDVPSSGPATEPLPPVPDAALFPPALGKTTSATLPVRHAVRPPWWNASIPRVDPISQLDRGPLQNVNCVMAAGAMLARLAYGIETTGSDLRALQDDLDGGTSLDDLETAVWRGWHAAFDTGALTTLQLRRVLYAGAGAVVIGNYGELPAGIRLSATFTGSHAVYVDAFRAPTADAPAAYYVIDPLGNPAAGYRGGWWSADVLERFAASFGGGLVDAAWAFAHGRVPLDHPILPRSAYPSGPPVLTNDGTVGVAGSRGTAGTDAGPVDAASPAPSPWPSPAPSPAPLPASLLPGASPLPAPSSQPLSTLPAPDPSGVLPSPPGPSPAASPSPLPPPSPSAVPSGEPSVEPSAPAPSGCAVVPVPSPTSSPELAASPDASEAPPASPLPSASAMPSFDPCPPGPPAGSSP